MPVKSRVRSLGGLGEEPSAVEILSEELRFLVEETRVLKSRVRSLGGLGEEPSAVSDIEITRL